MIDKEKAEKIALKYAKEYLVSKNDSHKQNILFKESSIIECERASLETAQWKDEQLEAEKQALIDKACEWLEDNAINYVDKDCRTAWRSVFADFRMAMKGGNYGSI